MGEGEPVACVVNSLYFQQSLTWGNHTLSLDPVCHLRVCCLDAHVSTENDGDAFILLGAGQLAALPGQGNT